MKDIVIFGATDFGRMMKYYLEEDGKYRVLGFTVHQKYMENNTYCGVPVVEFEIIEQIYDMSKVEILVAIGNNKMNDIRKMVFEECSKMGFHIASFIHNSVKVHNSEIGYGNIILENVLLYPFTKIGDGNLLWDNVLITHDCIVGNYNTLCAHADLCGYVEIGNNCFLGKQSVIKEYCKIANYTLIGATAYVDKHTHMYDVIVPARSSILSGKKSIDIM